MSSEILMECDICDKKFDWQTLHNYGWNNLCPKCNLVFMLVDMPDHIPAEQTFEYCFNKAKKEINEKN